MVTWPPLRPFIPALVQFRQFMIWSSKREALQMLSKCFPVVFTPTTGWVIQLLEKYTENATSLSTWRMSKLESLEHVKVILAVMKQLKQFFVCFFYTCSCFITVTNIFTCVLYPQSIYILSISYYVNIISCNSLSIIYIYCTSPMQPTILFNRCSKHNKLSQSLIMSTV